MPDVIFQRIHLSVIVPERKFFKDIPVPAVMLQKENAPDIK
jgi:hypothetical protein